MEKRSSSRRHVPKGRKVMKKERLLIIGGTSYIGRNLGHYLSSNYEITLTYHNHPINIKNCYTFKVNLSDPIPFSGLKQCEAFDHIIWCAQPTDYSQSLDIYGNIIDINIFGIQKALEFSRSNAAKNFIYLSSGTIYETPDKLKLLDEKAPINPKSYYGFSKYVAEQICQHYALSTNMRITILRLFTVYGPNQKNKVIPRLWNCIKKEQEISLNRNVGMVFNAIYIEDLTKIIYFFLKDITDYRYDIYNVANPEILKLVDICQLIGRIENKEPKIKSVDKPILYSIANTQHLKNKFSQIKFTSMEDGIRNIFNEGFE